MGNADNNLSHNHQFDFGAVKMLAGEAKAVGINRPLVVTDKGVRDCGVLDKVLEQLPDAMAVSTFDGTPENPTENAVLDALSQYRDGECDGMIAVGGGRSGHERRRHPRCFHEPARTIPAIFGSAAKISVRLT